LKFGGLVSVRNRDFTSRTLRYAVSSNSPAVFCPDGDLDACTDALFVPSNINPMGGPLTFQEVTQDKDSYDAKLNVFAGYVMADLSLAERFRLILGERVERTDQTVDPYDQFGIATTEAGGDIKETDLLPSVSFVWSTTEKTKLRGSLTRTLARPQLRELAPFIYQDFFGGRNQTGNKDLELTHIVNADLRYEYFPTLREVLAASIFFKKFSDPIEPIVTLDSSNGQITYRNAKGATLYGVEFEARKGLEFLSESLKNFNVVTNLTLATSSIEVGKEEKLALTNLSRPLVKSGDR
jgi:outer membrane receptor protein involved in Fe transport